MEVEHSVGVGAPGRGRVAPFDDFGLPDPDFVLGTDNQRGAFYSLGGGGDICTRKENVFAPSLTVEVAEKASRGEEPGGYGGYVSLVDQESVIPDPAPAEIEQPRRSRPACLERKAWDGASGATFFVWDLDPGSR